VPLPRRLAKISNLERFILLLVAASSNVTTADVYTGYYGWARSPHRAAAGGIIEKGPWRHSAPREKYNAVRAATSRAFHRLFRRGLLMVGHGGLTLTRDGGYWLTFFITSSLLTVGRMAEEPLVEATA
jgi:hypothetical protein